jgi:indole-3-glycerol phosphate synthase
MREVDGTIVANADRRAAAAAWHGLLQEQPSSTHAVLGRTRLPILLVLAVGSDTAAEAERFQHAVAHAELRSLESGHDLLADAPEATIALVSEWLRSASSRLTKLSSRRMAGRRFSQAISEGDGISVVVEVHDLERARSAASDGAEAIALRGELSGVRDVTELPILWRAAGAVADAAGVGADACLLVVADYDEGDERLAELHREALELGLDCVVEVRSETELERALERLDPEIFLLSGDAADADDVLRPALELLPDVPAGKLAVADVPAPNREQVHELERAGVDAVIVGPRDVGDLVGDAHPPV